MSGTNKQLAVLGYRAGKPEAFLVDAGKRNGWNYRQEKKKTLLLQKWDRLAEHAKKGRTRKKYAGRLRRYMARHRCPITYEAARIWEKWGGPIWMPSEIDTGVMCATTTMRSWWTREPYTRDVIDIVVIDEHDEVQKKEPAEII